MTKTIKNRKKHNKTSKCRFSNKTHIIKKLMEMLNMIKLYHWKTDNYGRHVASDDMYKKMDSHIDKFVEIYLGKNKTRIKKWDNQLKVIQYNRENTFKSKLLEYREMLSDLNLCFDEKKDTDILTVRDDILSDLNQFLYLLSFK
tara:strand:+ start:886 stop:1317 length:432 start_codon:yes stop_codon:yes gene_type:complete